MNLLSSVNNFILATELAVSPDCFLFLIAISKGIVRSNLNALLIPVLPTLMQNTIQCFVHWNAALVLMMPARYL